MGPSYDADTTNREPTRRLALPRLLNARIPRVCAARSTARSRKCQIDQTSLTHDVFRLPPRKPAEPNDSFRDPREIDFHFRDPAFFGEKDEKQ